MKKRYHRAIVNKIGQFRLLGERVSNGNKKLDGLVSALFFSGLILLLWVMMIYNKTIIELKIPLMIWLIPGVVLTPLFYNTMNYIEGVKVHWILHYILHTCMTGTFILFAFMASNFYCADNQIEKKTFEIIRTESSVGSKGYPKKKRPCLLINYEGIEKELIFYRSEVDRINSAKIVNLRVKKGLWGFDILEKYDAE
jgi:hypothetical protein